MWPEWEAMPDCGLNGCVQHPKRFRFRVPDGCCMTLEEIHRAMGIPTGPRVNIESHTCRLEFFAFDGLDKLARVRCNCGKEWRVTFAPEAGRDA